MEKDRQSFESAITTQVTRGSAQIIEELAHIHRANTARSRGVARYCDIYIRTVYIESLSMGDMCRVQMPFPMFKSGEVSSLK